MKLTLSWFKYFYIIVVFLIIGIFVDDLISSYLRAHNTDPAVSAWGDLVLLGFLFMGAYIQLHLLKRKQNK